jgi:purine nucleosidase
VAVLHTLANQGRAEILAMTVSAINPSAVDCLLGLNSYFGRPTIPVGQVQGEGVADESLYSEAIAQTFAPRGVHKPAAIDALSLYRRVLAGQADNSVVVITTGYLTNLRNLLASPPDGDSPLSGADLVTRKVKRLVTMGGQYPKGREWNFYRDAAATATVVAEWPTEILFVGYEAGNHVLTGSGLAVTPEGNPLRLGYQLYNGLSDRSSWDQLTVWYGITGDDPAVSPPLFTRQRGVNTVLDDGANTWRKDPLGKHAYARNSLPVEKLSAAIENMMATAVLGGGR